MKVLIALCIFLSAAINIACAQETPSTSSSGGSRASKTAIPTDEDRRAVARFTSLVKEFDKPEGPARELTNVTRNGRTPLLLSTMNSTRAVDLTVLEEARGLVGWILPQLEAVKTMPPPSPYVVKKRRAPIQIDGKFDEADWQTANEIWLQYDRTKKIATPPTKARLLWDSEYLYAAFTVPDTSIIAPVLPRDGDVWRYDCVELFLLPDRRFGTYWELELGPTGSVLDYLCYKHRNRWGGDFRVAETMHGLQVGRVIRGTANKSDDTDEGYSMEVAIPFNQLPGMAHGPQPGDKMLGFLGWIQRDRENEERSAAIGSVPFVSWFHNIWDYQPWVFSDKR